MIAKSSQFAAWVAILLHYPRTLVRKVTSTVVTRRSVVLILCMVMNIDNIKFLQGTSSQIRLKPFFLLRTAISKQIGDGTL